MLRDCEVFPIYCLLKYKYNFIFIIHQEYTFTIKSIDLSSDPVLAAAFGASLHSVVVPGMYQKCSRSSLMPRLISSS